MFEVESLSRETVVVIQVPQRSEVEELDDRHVEADVERRGPVRRRDAVVALLLRVVDLQRRGRPRAEHNEEEEEESPDSR